MARKSKWTDAQIIGFLKEVEAGTSVADLIRRVDVSEQTYYRWKARFGGMDVSEAQEKRRLEEENKKLRAMVADMALDIQALKSALGRKW